MAKVAIADELSSTLARSWAARLRPSRDCGVIWRIF